jgi:hypothetical protein
VAANSNTGLVLARAGASGSPKPISGFIALIWKNRLNKRSSLAMSLFSTSSSVQMIEGNEVTKLLVTRLASLLWRLRRAVTIESGLLSIRAGIIRDQSVARPTIELNTDRLSIFRQFLRPGVESQRHEQRETN